MNDRQEQARHPVELLPWLANGTLEGDEREAVERHLAGCAACREELRFLQALRAGVKAGWAQESPGELGWARLRAAVRRERQAPEGRRRRWMPAPRVVAMAASVLVVVQAGVIAFLVGRPGGGTALYQPLGAETRPVLQVRFRPEVSEARIRAVLREAGVEIVSGPGALGIYEVAPVAEGAAALAEARRRLEAAEDVVAEVRGP